MRPYERIRPPDRGSILQDDICLNQRNIKSLDCVQGIKKSLILSHSKVKHKNSAETKTGLRDGFALSGFKKKKLISVKYKLKRR